MACGSEVPKVRSLGIARQYQGSDSTSSIAPPTVAPPPPIAAPDWTNHPPPAIASPPTDTPTDPPPTTNPAPVTMAVAPSVNRHQQRRSLLQDVLRRRTVRGDDCGAGRHRQECANQRDHSDREYFRHLHRSSFLEKFSDLRRQPDSQCSFVGHQKGRPRATPIHRSRRDENAPHERTADEHARMR